MSKNNRSLLGIYTIGIAALFLVGFLLLVVFGAGSYQDSVGARESHSAQRALLSYISTSVQQTELGHVHVDLERHQIRGGMDHGSRLDHDLRNRLYAHYGH